MTFSTVVGDGSKVICAKGRRRMWLCFTGTTIQADPSKRGCMGSFRGIVGLMVRPQIGSGSYDFLWPIRQRHQDNLCQRASSYKVVFHQDHSCYFHLELWFIVVPKLAL